MTLEADITAVLKTCCPRVKPDFAPFDTPRPYVIYQGVGGQDHSYVDNTATDLENTELQVTVWADTRIAANALMAQITAAFRAAGSLTATPIGRPVWGAEEDLNLYSSQQDFDLNRKV